MMNAAVIAADPDKGAVGIKVYREPPTYKSTRYRFPEKALQLIRDPGTMVAQVCLPSPLSVLQ